MSLGWIALVVFVAFFIIVLRQSMRGAKDAAAAREKQEALFKASFPELQPYFHPLKVLQFVDAWRARPLAPQGFDWDNPPGLGASRARFAAPGPKGAPVELLDVAGSVVSSFVIQDHPEGAALRVGPGKLTINVRDSAVRYWHPEREFKWSKTRGWRVLSALSDRGIDSSDRGMSFSSESSSSSSATSAAAVAAGAAVVAGAGGAFDGGGSSSSWDESSESKTSY